MDEKKKVRFQALKYDLEELFENTPIFDVPPMNFQEEEKEYKIVPVKGDFLSFRKEKNSWDCLGEMILNKNTSNVALKYLKEMREKQQFDKIKKPNFPFYYLQKNNIKKMRRFAQILKSKTIGKRNANTVLNFGSFGKDSSNEEELTLKQMIEEFEMDQIESKRTKKASQNKSKQLYFRSFVMNQKRETNTEMLSRIISNIEKNKGKQRSQCSEYRTQSEMRSTMAKGICVEDQLLPWRDNLLGSSMERTKDNSSRQATQKLKQSFRNDSLLVQKAGRNSDLDTFSKEQNSRGMSQMAFSCRKGSKQNSIQQPSEERNRPNLKGVDQNQFFFQKLQESARDNQPSQLSMSQKSRNINSRMNNNFTVKPRVLANLMSYSSSQGKPSQLPKLKKCGTVNKSHIKSGEFKIFDDVSQFKSNLLHGKEDQSIYNLKKNIILKRRTEKVQDQDKF